MIRTGIGQSSRRFLPADSSKPCVIAGLIFDDIPGFQSSSDGDVVFQALANAITSLTHVEIIGGLAEDLFTKDGITDSEVYLKQGLESLHKQKVTYISITLEAKRPNFKQHFSKMRHHIARLFGIDSSQVGITAISGDGLTDFGCGDGVQCFALITTVE